MRSVDLFIRLLFWFQAVTAGATDVTIVSGDKDLAQLVTRRVNMLNFYTGEALGPEEVSGVPRLLFTLEWLISVAIVFPLNAVSR